MFYYTVVLKRTRLLLIFHSSCLLTHNNSCFFAHSYLIISLFAKLSKTLINFTLEKEQNQFHHNSLLQISKLFYISLTFEQTTSKSNFFTGIPLLASILVSLHTHTCACTHLAIFFRHLYLFLIIKFFFLFNISLLPNEL